ncbi:MAG TPA: LacI family DNA-binding transcriptional regulator, partial [bacterium]|nr:LacI family DNA-binding transcriptional regulator [bacterium]
EKVSLWEEVRRKHLRGAIVVPVFSQLCLQVLLELEEHNFPYVRFGRSFFGDKLKAPLVRGDDLSRTSQALKYLWDFGHRRIGLISAFRGNESEQVYLNFYREVPDFQPRWLMSLEFTGTEEQWQHYPGRQVARGYWEHNPDVTALVVENGFVTIDFLKEALAIRREVPRDLSLLSLTDWVGLERSVVPITAMHLSDKEMGEAAARVLLDLLQGQPSPPGETVLIPYRLIERGSVGRPSIFKGILGQRR